MFFRQSDLWSLTLKDKFRSAVSTERSDDTVPNVQSIRELMWQKVDTPAKDLLPLYLKLAKIRLTGGCNSRLGVAEGGEM